VVQRQITDGLADGVGFACQREGVAAYRFTFFVKTVFIIAADKQAFQRGVAAVSDVGNGLINMVEGRTITQHGVACQYQAGFFGIGYSFFRAHIREGFDSLNETSDQEEDMLDKAWGLEMDSRLSCQCVVGDEDLVVEIPKYNINHANEAAH